MDDVIMKFLIILSAVFAFSVSANAQESNNMKDCANANETDNKSACSNHTYKQVKISPKVTKKTKNSNEDIYSEKFVSVNYLEYKSSYKLESDIISF